MRCYLKEGLAHGAAGQLDKRCSQAEMSYGENWVVQPDKSEDMACALSTRVKEPGIRGYDDHPGGIWNKSNADIDNFSHLFEPDLGLGLEVRESLQGFLTLTRHLAVAWAPGHLSATCDELQHNRPQDCAFNPEDPSQATK